MLGAQPDGYGPCDLKPEYCPCEVVGIDLKGVGLDPRLFAQLARRAVTDVLCRLALSAN